MEDFATFDAENKCSMLLTMRLSNISLQQVRCHSHTCLYVVVFPTNQFSVFCLIVFGYIFWRAKKENHVSRTLSMFLLGNLMTTRMLFFTYGVIIVLSTFNNTGTNPSSISLELHSIVQIRVRNEGAEPIAFLRTRGWRSWLESKW